MDSDPVKVTENLPTPADFSGSKTKLTYTDFSVSDSLHALIKGYPPPGSHHRTKLKGNPLWS